ncbi:hypothetical protein [Streptomyces himalayensis]|uniref:Integral membrane protein n=1 Tax=Streptomyces himalayensis subsp. himalayensis TaxID=2756131 RepID=A0A7W0DFY7_9ACTN|nr:hypothetical protein [Streptomyces himalayensis]MBA2944381.1 hypothetical protein [Streptomyces himalayensis subsp. himalayensis]
MVWEALGSAFIGLALALLATRLLPHRLPARTLVLPTGVVGALFGAFVTHSALGAGHTALTLLGALAVAAALLSLLIRPAGLRRSATA